MRNFLIILFVIALAGYGFNHVNGRLADADCYKYGFDSGVNTYEGSVYCFKRMLSFNLVIPLNALEEKTDDQFIADSIFRDILQYHKRMR